MLTLKNSFHGTETRVHLSRDGMDQLAYLALGDGPHAEAARRKIRDVRKRLCPVEGCTCGNTWGERK